MTLFTRLPKIDLSEADLAFYGFILSYRRWPQKGTRVISTRTLGKPRLFPSGIGKLKIRGYLC